MFFKKRHVAIILWKVDTDRRSPLFTENFLTQGHARFCPVRDIPLETDLRPRRDLYYKIRSSAGRLAIMRRSEK